MKTLKKVDFHMHSNASDGLFSPQKLLKIAAAAGLSAAGITDHETINGLPEAYQAAKKLELELIPGVEISVLEDEQEIHILGYYPRNCGHLKAVLEEIRHDRFKRMELIISRLKKLGFKINPEEVLIEAGEAAPGRLHLARILFKKKYVQTLAEAFSLYLGRNCPAFVQRKTPALEEVMDLYITVKAITVLAHPGQCGNKIIEKLIRCGLKGIEVYHPDHGKTLARYYKNMAVEKKLLITGGSDFHGANLKRPEYPAHRAVPYSYLEKLKEHIK